MITLETLKDSKYKEYNGSVSLHMKRYDTIEIEYLAYLFLVAYKEHHNNGNGQALDNFFKDFFQKYSSRSTKAILEKSKKYFESVYNIKTYTVNDRYQNDYNHINIMSIINNIDGVDNNSSLFKCKVISATSRNPIMSINNIELSDEDYLLLKEAFSQEKKISKGFIFDYLKTHNIKKKGLCLNIAPTGSGKSYLTNNFISTDLLCQLIFNPSSNEKKVFYITDLKTNLFEAYNTSYDNIVSFCHNHHLNDDIQQYLLSKICCILSKSDLIKNIKQSSEFSVFYTLIENMAEKYNNKDILLQIKNQLDAIKSFDENSRFQIDDVYNLIKSFFLKHFPKCDKKEIKIINMFFIGEEILTKNKTGTCVFFLTTAKAVFGVESLYFKTCVFDEENNIFFIDESDKQYGILLSQSIKNTHEFDLYDMIRNISSIQYRKFKIDSSHGYNKIEKARLIFCNTVLQPFLNKYLYENSLELKNHNGTFNIFNDNINPFVINNKQFAKLSIDKDNNVNIIEIKSQDYIPYNKDGKEFTNLIRDSQRLLRFFVYFMRDIAITYSSQPKYNREMSHSDKIKLLLEEVNLLELLRYVTDYKKSRNYYDIIDKSLDITKLKPGYENVSLIQRKYSNNPNSMILRCAKKNFVNFISATANHDSVVTNFNMSYLRKNLGEHFIEYSQDDKKKLYSELAQKHGEINNNISINIGTPPNHIDRIDFDCFMHDCLIKEEDYIKTRLYEYFNCTFDFLSNPSSKVMLIATSAFPSVNTITKIDSLLRHQYKFTDFRIYPNKECEKFNAEFLRDTEKVSDMYKYLESDQKNKLVIITTYNTVGAGVNIQPTNTSGIKLSDYISIDRARRNDYDIDSLYLGKPTHLLTSTESSELNMEEILSILTHLRTLLVKNIISLETYNSLFRGMADNIKIKPQIDKLHKETQDYIYAVFAKVKQMIGRISRTNLRNKNINIYVSNELANTLGGQNIDVELFDTPEYLKFTNFISSFTPDVMFNKKMTFSLDIHANRNMNTGMFFEQVKGYILSNAYQEKNEDYIKRWHSLREVCLKSGVFLDKDAIDAISEIGFKECLLSFKEASSSYYIIPKGGLAYEYNNVSHINKKAKCERLIDEKHLNLHVIRLNKELSSYFNRNGYALEFKESNSAIPYPMVNDIYKGAIGEAIGEYVFQERFGIILNNDDIFKNNLFEVCDFFCLHPVKKIGVDMKNYNLFLNDEKYNKRILSKIEDKIENKAMDKIVIVNTFLDERKEAIIYGNITGCEFFSCDINKAKVCVINGLLRLDGYFCDYSGYLKTLKDWING